MNGLTPSRTRLAQLIHPSLIIAQFDFCTLFLKKFVMQKPIYKRLFRLEVASNGYYRKRRKQASPLRASSPLGIATDQARARWNAGPRHASAAKRRRGIFYAFVITSNLLVQLR